MSSSLLLILAATSLLVVSPSRGIAQPTPATPEEVAQRFFDGLSRLRWRAVSAQLHTGALDEFHLISRQLVESLRGDSILIQLYDATREEWEGWSGREVFERSMSGLTRYARGLMESQVMTDFRVLGTVPEGDTIRHVVYRETDRPHGHGHRGGADDDLGAGGGEVAGARERGARGAQGCPARDPDRAMMRSWRGSVAAPRAAHGPHLCRAAVPTPLVAIL